MRCHVGGGRGPGRARPGWRATRDRGSGDARRARTVRTITNEEASGGCEPPLGSGWSIRLGVRERRSTRLPAGYVASPRPTTVKEAAAALRTDKDNGSTRPDQVRDYPYDPVAVRTRDLRVVLCWKRLRWARSIRLCAGLIRRPALIMRGQCVLACLESGLNPPPIPCIETGYRSTCHFVSRLQCCGPRSVPGVC